jgi:hypothetical protein
MKVCRLHVAIFGIYYFSYIDQTGSKTHCMELTNFDDACDAGFEKEMKVSS